MRQQVGRRRLETLDYLQAMLGQLRQMAQAEGCDMLSYLIEMSYLEAVDIVRGERTNGERSSRVQEDQRDSPA